MGALVDPLPLGAVPDPVLVATDLSKTYGIGDATVHALDDVSLELGRHQFTAVMGPSGSGKSTLLQCLAGLDRATSGSILLDGNEITSMSERQLTALRRDQIGFIFQSFNLIPTLNAKQNILLPAKIAGKKVDASFLAQIVDAVGLSQRLQHLPTQLSGGQQQRVACARALITRPSVIFADEPTGNLDSKATTQVLKFLRRAADEFHQSVVMVTHEAGAAAYADRVIFLADGKVAAEMSHPTRDGILEALRILGDDAAELEVGGEGTTDLTTEVSISTPGVEPDVPDIYLAQVPSRQTLTPLQESLNEIAPPEPLSGEAAQVVGRAQQILEGLPGTIMGPSSSEDTLPGATPAQRLAEGEEEA